MNSFVLNRLTLNRAITKRILAAVLIYCISFSSIANVIPGIPGIPDIPKIPAFLPTMDQVPATQPMPIDGTWLLPSVGKKIRIDSGRAYAVDGWLHLFVLDIQPGMVVWKNVMPTGPGQYSGEDLPLMGRFTARVTADRSLSITISGMFGPITIKALPIQLNNDGWYRQEMQAAGLAVQNFGGQQQGGYQMSQPPGNNQYQQGGNNQYQQGGNNQYQQGGNNQYQQGGNNQYQQGGNNQYQQGGNNQYQQGGNNQYQQGGNNQYQQGGNNQYQQGGNNQQKTEEALDCEETVYDPETDTTSCYIEGEEE